MLAWLRGDDFAKSVLRTTYATARQHGWARGKQTRELPPTCRSALEVALDDARRYVPAFTVVAPENRLDSE
jgi:hypothetical protein